MSIPCDSAALHSTLKNGSRAEIFEILRSMVNLNSTYDNGDTVYHMILRNEKLLEEDIIAISQVFRDRKVNPNARNKKAKAALHLATENRMRNVVVFFMRCRNPKTPKPSNTLTKFFVEDERVKFWHKAEQNSGNSELWNSEKIESESASFLELLVSIEYDFDRKNNDGISSLDVAIDYNLQHLLPVLLRRANIIDAVESRTRPPLHRFLVENYCARLKHGYQRSRHWYSSYSSRYATEIVQILLSKGAAVNSHWSTGVQWAIKHGEQIGIIKILFNYFPSGCDERSFATSLLNDLMEYPCADLTAWEIDSYLKILRHLVAKGADINQENKLDMLPVQVAAKAKNKYAVIWLDEIGTDFDVLTKNNENLLHLLVTEKGTDDEQEVAVIDLLVRKGCQIYAKDKAGASPLHLATKYNNVALARKLIEYGAEVNCRDDEMQTPLHYTVEHNKAVEMTELLLENGANPNAKDTMGRRPLFTRNLNTSKVLLKWGAQVNYIHSMSGMSYLGSIGVDIFKEFLKYGLDIIPDYGYFRKISLYEYGDMNTLLVQHCIKLKAAKLPYLKKLKPFMQNDKHKQFDQDCLVEIETVKTTFIDSRTSIYHFLHMDHSCRYMYINKDKLKNLIDSPVLQEQFPKYADIIFAKYHEAVMKKSLLGPAKAVWLELTEIVLPDICLERILSHLSNINLADMIDAD